MKKLLLIAVLVLTTSAAYAQEKGKFGINYRTGSVSSIGITYHILDKIALRPSVGFSSRIDDEIRDRTSTDGTIYTFNEKRKYSNVSTGLGLLYYVQSQDDFSIYVMPELLYSKQSEDRPNFRYNETSDEYFVEIFEARNTNYYFNGMIGLQYKFKNRFNIIGEFGFEYRYIKSSYGDAQSTDIDKRTATNLMLKSAAIGITFYLN